MSEAKVAQKAPYPVDVKPGDKLFWCRCGRSETQPFCDGSHKDTNFTPVAFTAEENKTLFFCGCKQTGDAPFCDGTHNGL